MVTPRRQFEILDAIVQRVVVSVMDHFVTRESATKMLFHHGTVFVAPTIVGLDLDVWRAVAGDSLGSDRQPLVISGTPTTLLGIRTAYSSRLQLTSSVPLPQRLALLLNRLKRSLVAWFETATVRLPTGHEQGG